MVAEEAGVSTGMLNHYFANRQDLLMHALDFVSERAHGRMVRRSTASRPVASGLTALLDAVLADGDDQDAGRDLARVDQRLRRGGAPAGAAPHDRVAPEQLVLADRQRAGGHRAAAASRRLDPLELAPGRDLNGLAIRCADF